MMKNPLIFFLVGVLAVGTGVGLIGCGGSEHTGEKTNVDSEKGSTSLFPDSSCSEQDIDQRLLKVNKKIEDKIKDKLEGQYNVANGFKFKTEKKDGYLIVFVEGHTYGSDGLKDLANILNDFNKKGCVAKVRFLPEGSFERETFRTDPGFEWTSCPYPSLPCPTGECACKKDLDSNSSGESVSNSAGSKPSGNGNERDSNSNPAKAP